MFLITYTQIILNRQIVFKISFIFLQFMKMMIYKRNSSFTLIRQDKIRYK